MFCPECGKSLSVASEVSVAATAAEAAAPTVPPQRDAVETPPGKPSAESLQTSSPGASAHLNAANEVSQPDPVTAAVVEDTAGKVSSTASAESPGKVERTREKLHRASTAARGAIEGNVKRVEKIRHASTAVFEEASYDPSLRFVLVALGLFVVFVILLVLSKVMG